MGFFSFIGDVVQTVVFDTFNTTLGIAKDVFGSEEFKGAATIGAGALIGGPAGAALGAASVTGVGLGAGPGPGLQVIAVPIQVQAPQQTFAQPTSRGGISGGSAAFGNFGLSQPGRGNPSWLFSGTSVTSSGGRVVSSGTSQGQWQVSGTSVRLLA